MDVLSAVLRELRLDSASYRALELDAPWRLRFDGGLRGVHIVVSGRCTLTVDGHPARPLTAGDLVVLPRADSHVLQSIGAESGPILSALELTRRTPGNRLAAGGSAERTLIVCGAFFLAQDDHPAVLGMPSCIYVPGQDGKPAAWLAGLTEALRAETFDGGPGSDVVMARLSDALVTRALRYYVEQAEHPGWLRGLGDPHIARALAVVHDDLAAPLTLNSLAKEAGLSRASFAARFSSTVGQSPMRYLYGCRMRRAMNLLRMENATSAAIAASVGYGSESALSNAFVRHTGMTPGAYRSQARKLRG
jgi:AraC-like DNA-binding protein